MGAIIINPNNITDNRVPFLNNVFSIGSSLFRIQTYFVSERIDFDTSVILSDNGVDVFTISNSALEPNAAGKTLGSNLNPFDSIYVTNLEGVILPNAQLATDPVSLADLNAAIAGIDLKDPARAATTANIDLATGGLLTIDNVSLNENDRVLVRLQTNSEDNGLYLAKSGAWVRTADADIDAEVTTGLSVTILEGTDNGLKRFTLTTQGTIVLGTTPLTFSETSSGAGLTPPILISQGGTGQTNQQDGLNALTNAVGASDGDVLQIVSGDATFASPATLDIPSIPSVTLQTTDATATPIYTVEVPDNSTIGIRGIVHGLGAGGESYTATIDAAAYRQGGGAVLIGSPAIMDDGSKLDIWDVSVNDTGNNIEVLVFGEAATTIDWKFKALVG